MSDWNWSDPAELIQISVSGKGWKGNRGPTTLMKGSVSQLVRHLRHHDIDDMWKFAIVIEGSHYLRSADLRAAVRDPGCPD